MKNLVVVLLFVSLALLLGALGSGQSPDDRFDPNNQLDSVNQGDRIASIHDEYWPFEKTVKQYDPSLLEVVNVLEGTR